MWPEYQAGLRASYRSRACTAHAGRAPSMPAVSRRIVLLLVALVAVRVATVPLFLGQDATRGPHTVLPGDVRRYHRIAISHTTPYRDFPLEYPPLTLAAIEAIDRGSVRSTTVWLMWSQLLVDLGIAGLLAWAWGRRAALAYLLIGLPFVTYPFLYLRLDLVAVLLAVAGAALVRKRLPAAGGAALAVACFAKIWPVAVMPVLLVRRAWRGIAAIVVIGVTGVLAWLAWSGTTGIQQVVTFRGAKGWQLESTPGILVRTLTNDPVRVESGAWRVGVASGLARDILGLAMLMLLVVVWALAARARDPGPAVLDGVAPLTAIVVFLVLSPILSPQYVCWLVPYAAVAAVEERRVYGWITATIVALSVLNLFLVKEETAGAWYAVSVVWVRDAVLVGLLIVGLLSLARGGRADRGHVGRGTVPEDPPTPVAATL